LAGLFLNVCDLQVWFIMSGLANM